MHVAVHVGDGDLGVVERGQNVGDADGNVLRALGLDDLLGIGVLAQQFGGGRRGGRGNGSARSSRRGPFGGRLLGLG